MLGKEPTKSEKIARKNPENPPISPKRVIAPVTTRSEILISLLRDSYRMNMGSCEGSSREYSTLLLSLELKFSNENSFGSVKYYHILSCRETYVSTYKNELRFTIE